MVMDTSKADWKLFREKIGDWQEAYMERLVKQYIKLLSSEKDASDKFWALDERLKKDKKRPGVQLELNKSEMECDLARLIKDKVITMDDLAEFSDECRERVEFYLERLR